MSPEEKAKITELCKALTEECLAVLREVMHDRDAPAAARVSAVTAIWDRGHGRPSQTLEHTGKDGGPIETADVSALSPVEREQRLLAISLALQGSQQETRH